MNIEPLPSSYPREISVTDAFEPAYERVKKVLFKPFDLGKWIVIGFGAWLAGLGESGGGGGGSSFNGLNGGGSNFHGAREELMSAYHQACEFVVLNLYWILPLAIGVAIIGLIIWLLILWLSSRGKFMFLHCVALDRAEVEVPWHHYARPANSLFRFRIGLAVLGLLLFLPLIAGVVIAIGKMVIHGEPTVSGVMMAVGLFLLSLLLGLVFALVRKLLVDFVVPIMYLRGGTCLAAWRELNAMLAAHPGSFLLYILFQIVLSIAIGILVVMVVIATCCIAGCLMLIPFIGTVLLLPVLVFQRAYPLYYLAQFGPEYNVFPEPPAPSPMMQPDPLAGGI